MVERKSHTILVVEDEQYLRESTRFYLEDNEFIVLEAENGKIGLELFYEKRPDLVLVDLRMPEVDGLEVLTEIQKTNPEVPVIVMSGTGLIGDVVEAIHTGAWDYILKPLEDLSVLKHAILKALERVRLRHENRLHQEHLERLVEEKSKELADSEKKLHSVLSSIPDIVYRLNPEGNITFVNDSVRKYGYSPESLIGKNVMELVHPDDRTRVECQMKERRTGSRRTTALEVRLFSKTKEDIPFEIVGQPIDMDNIFLLESEGLYTSKENGEKKFIGSQGIARDITKRKQTEESLKTSEQRFSLLVKRSPLGVIEWDLDFKVVRWNKAAERIFGFTAEEAVGHHAAELIVPESAREIVDNIWKSLLEDKGGQRSTNKNIRKTGEIITCEWNNTALIANDGRILGVASIVEDITEKLRLEEQLSQTRKMEAIGNLAGGVAHDFNNLLTAITGHAELALMTLKKDEPLYRDISEIIKTADRAADLTRRLLAFSRKQIISPKVLNLNASLLNMDKLLRRTIGEHIELKSIPRQNLGNIKADPSQVEQIVVNLAVNARDAMPGGGMLTIETANVELDDNLLGNYPEMKKGAYVLLSVSDNGTGMDDETQSRIFEPFYTTKMEGKGTGLGLATVYGIVKQNHGLILVDSKLDVGSTFKIYFPRIDEEVDTAKLDEKSQDKLEGTESILVVEDNDLVRTSAVRTLERFGYKVTSAQSGPDALEILSNYDGNFDLMLTDIVMPVMSGTELVEKMEQAGYRIKFLYMSGYTEDAIVHHGVLKPGIPYIQKPFKPVRLLAMIRDLLDRQTADIS